MGLQRLPSRKVKSEGRELLYDFALASKFSDILYFEMVERGFGGFGVDLVCWVR